MMIDPFIDPSLGAEWLKHRSPSAAEQGQHVSVRIA